jgi:hypothetical protein
MLQSSDMTLATDVNIWTTDITITNLQDTTYGQI